MLPRLSRTLRATPLHLLSRDFLSSSAPLVRARPINVPKYTPISSPRHFSSYPPRQARYNRFGDSGGQSGGGPGFQSSPNTAQTVVIGMSILAGTYYIAHLERVPETGRWRFMDISPKYEASLAEATNQQVLQEFKGRMLPPNHPLTRHIRNVVSRILEANHLGSLADTPRVAPPSPMEMLFGTGNPPEGAWDPDATPHPREGEASGEGSAIGPNRRWNLVVVKDDKMVNAMATPGTIIVFTGILPVCRDEQGLAAVLGHEIAHVVARHSAESYSYSKVLIFMALLLDSLNIYGGFSALLRTFLLELPRSRKQELEADMIGLRLSAKACYDPTAAPSMFARLAELEKRQSGSLSIDFLQTHPASEKRVKLLEAQLPEAFDLQARSSECAGVADKLAAFRDSFGGSSQGGAVW